jgi:hypothetical protein
MHSIWGAFKETALGIDEDASGLLAMTEQGKMALTALTGKSYTGNLEDVMDISMTQKEKIIRDYFNSYQ